MKNLNCGVYQVRNLVTMFCYIGQAVNLKGREAAHWSSLKRGKHFNRHLQRSFNKHGKDNFIFEILMYCRDEDLTKYEQMVYDIDKYHGKTYNIRECVDSSKGVKYSLETRAKMSILAKKRFSDPKNHPFFGRRPSKESIEKNRASNLGKVATKEQRIKQLKNTPKGVQCHSAKLNNQKVKKIRILINKFSDKEIAKKFNVSDTCIWKIRNGKSWREV